MNQECYSEVGIFYLVRLREGFRLRTIQPRDVTVHFNQIKKLFKTHEAARAYAQNTLPTDKNPFDMDTSWGLSVHSGFIVIAHWEADDDGFEEGGKDKHLPSLIVPEALIMLGDSETRIEDFTQSCQRIGVVPPNLGENWYRSFGDFSDNALGEAWQNDLVTRLRQWWEDNKDVMTDEQKAAIWRTLHPRPYEIVSVPLERVAQ